MESVFPLDARRLGEFHQTKNEVAINVQTQPTKVEDTASNEIGLTPKKPPMTVVAYKFHRKLESM
jgi:hypothetical protein